MRLVIPTGVSVALLIVLAVLLGTKSSCHSHCDVVTLIIFFSISFAIMLWEILAMRPPFELYTMKSLKAKVWEGGKRPGVDESWPVSMKLLLKRSWTEDLSARNNMTQISGILRKECVRARGGDDAGLEHQRRRSTFVFRPQNGKKQQQLGRAGRNATSDMW